MSDPLRDRLAAALGPTYELQRLLGRGGMGSVYLARETALDRLVAVKVLPPEVTGDTETRERFRREARTAAKLTHPHIVPLYTFGEADGLLWFVMGYVAGETLAGKLERTPRLDPEIVRRVLADVADALDYAHSHGIVHRDVKPENILIEDAGGKALLADFGVARAGTGSTTLTTAGALVGTPLYMSPEQASGERDLDGRSDIYSLGVVGYRMLAGRTPFEGADLRAVLAAHVMQPAPALPTDVAEDLAAAVARAMAKEPLERWGSGKRFAEAIGTSEQATTEALELLLPLPSFLSGSGLAFLGLLYVWATFSAGAPWQGFWASPRNLLLLGAIVVAAQAPLGLLYFPWRYRISFRKALRMALWPPSWWMWPWWVGWRRPGDVWTRLPPAIRSARTQTFAAALVGYLHLLWLPYFARQPETPFGLIAGVAITATAALAWLFISMHKGFRFGSAAGLDRLAASKLVSLATWNQSFWRRPEVARLLGSRKPAPPSAEPQTPPEVAAGVRRIAASLPSHHASLAQDAIGRADAIAKRIALMDTELASLAKDVRQEDVVAVERKITELGPERADEPAARREIRQMHQQQLAVLQRLQRQVEEGQGRRKHLAGLLRTLYLQVSELNVETKRLSEADTSGVREIVDRMAREVEGLREVGQ